MNEKRFIVFPNNVVWDNQLGEVVCRCILEGIGDAENVCQRLNEQQATIDKQRLRLQQLEELLELSENLNKRHREKLIDMNLKMVIDDDNQF